MRVQDVVNMARYSEVSSTAIKDNIEAIVLFINAGMIELYKRFPIMTKEHVVELFDGTTSYALPADYLYVVSAYEELDVNGAVELVHVPINDEEEARSIYFPNHKELQVPASADNTFISLIYVSKPPFYEPEDLSDEIELPDSLIECLLHYVGYKAHLGIRSDGQSETNAHFMRFERSCDKARELGVSHPIDSLRSPYRLGQRGFV